MPAASWRPAGLPSSIARSMPIRGACWPAVPSSTARSSSSRNWRATRPGSTGRWRADAVIEVGDGTISFGSGAGRIDAVRGVSFKVAQGEAFGLVGESGCGKSTLLRAIAGLQDMASGAIVLAGHNVGGKRSRADRRLVQMVFQDPYGSLNPTPPRHPIRSEPLTPHD